MRLPAPPVRDCPLPGVNVYVVHREKLITAPLGNSVLPGITRDSVLQIARELGITLVEPMIPREMLYIADEAFFTGTAAEVTPIRSVDKIDVGKGAIGPITKGDPEGVLRHRARREERPPPLAHSGAGAGAQQAAGRKGKSTRSGMRIVRSKPDHSDRLEIER